jgi:succinoglycan biosynthesis protein ExoA
MVEECDKVGTNLKIETRHTRLTLVANFENHPQLFSMKISLISIIVPCRNERKHIQRAISSILSQESVQYPFEVIVADGQSEDGTREILAGIAATDLRLQVIDNLERITSTGLNAAILAAHGEIIIRMDTHSEYASDYVSSCVNVLLATNARNVGGPARTKAEGYIQRANAVAYHSRFSAGGAHFHDANYEGWVDTVTYGCWRKTTLLELGLFDDELVRNQDDELNYRLTKAGGGIWQSPSIRSWYYPRASLVKLFQQYMQYGYWKVRVIQKHRIPAAYRHLVPGGFIASILVLSLLSLVFELALLSLIALLGLYFLVNLTASLICCRHKSEWQYLAVMPIVFVAYHFGYGLGFLRGVIDFYLLGRTGRGRFSRLTR